MNQRMLGQPKNTKAFCFLDGLEEDYEGLMAYKDKLKPVITLLGDPNEEWAQKELKSIFDTKNSVIPYNVLVDLSHGNYAYT